MFSVFLACIFLASHILEVSFIHTLPAPFFLFPLSIILGILTIHRGYLVIGVIWLCLSGPIISRFGFDDTSLFAYITMALLAIPLAKRIFVERSVYAMEGLGATLFIAFSAVNILAVAIAKGDIWQATLSHLITLVWLIFGLYISLILLVPLERFTKNFLRRSEL